MPKRKTPIQRLAESVAEIGIEEAGKHFEFLKAMKPPAPKPKVVSRKEKKKEGIFYSVHPDSEVQIP